jgi:hypothetical protein
MVNKRSMGGMVAAFSILLAFPALASAHTLSVTAGPSQCITPLNGQYTATVTITEAAFSGSTENIPVGQNVQRGLLEHGQGEHWPQPELLHAGSRRHPDRPGRPRPTGVVHLPGER